MHPEFNVRDFLNTKDMTEQEISRCEFWTTANRIVRESGKFNFEESKIPVNFDWDLNLMENWLEGYKDKEVIKYLRFGWPLNAYNTSVNTEIPENQLGTRSHPNEVREYLKKKRQTGSLIGPFKKKPFGKFARFSHLDTVPKKESKEMRIILNLSHPFEGDSGNASIDKTVFANSEDMSMRYPSVDDLAKIIRKKGRKAHIFIRDLSKAYHQL